MHMFDELYVMMLMVHYVRNGSSTPENARGNDRKFGLARHRCRVPGLGFGRIYGTVAMIFRFLFPSGSASTLI